MTKKLKVDVETSLGYQTNGRLKPADKSEYANKNLKKYKCPECDHRIELSETEFGESMLCPNCNKMMIRIY